MWTLVHFIRKWWEWVAINHKIDYKSYCKYSLLYEPVMGWMKWLKVSKVSFSLFKLLESSEKTLQNMWSAARPPSLYHQCCCFERSGSMWKTEDHPTRWQTVLSDCHDQQVLVSHLTLPKVELCFGARNLYCNHLLSSLGNGLLLSQTCNKTPA